MARIARHEVGLDWCREGAAMEAKMPEMYLKALPKNLGHANMCRSTMESYAGYLAVVDPDSPQICAAIRLGAQATAALFAAAAAGQGEVEVTLGDKAVRAPANTVTKDLHDVGNWLGGFFLGVLCRERPLLDLLCGIPTDLLRASSTKGEEYAYLYADALRAFWRKEDEAPGLLLGALEATDPERLAFAAEGYVLDLVVPQMEVLYRVMDQDAPAFNEALDKALQLHRDYWSTKAGARKNDPKGYLALALTATASFAFEAEMPIEVESDYLLPRLVQGECHP